MYQLIPIKSRYMHYGRKFIYRSAKNKSSEVAFTPKESFVYLCVLFIEHQFSIQKIVDGKGYLQILQNVLQMSRSMNNSSNTE